ncbi:MAG: DNA replication and repair protein RecF [Acidobacteriota bacterium]
MLLELKARGFRNLEPLDLAFGAGAHLFLGDNGAGKTSVLEAVYLLSTTRSFRTANLVDCRHHGSESFFLNASVLTASGAKAELGLSLVGAKRQRSLNGSSTSLAEHLKVLPVVAWSAADSDLLTASPQPRRRFLDRGVVSLRPQGLDDLARYRRALAHKRELLRRGQQSQLRLWNRMLASAAVPVIRQRTRYVELLEREFFKVLQAQDLGFDGLELRYRPSPRWFDPRKGSSFEPAAPAHSALNKPAGAGPATRGPANRGAVFELPGDEELEALFLQGLEAIEADELRRAMPLLGPHRDDLGVVWSSKRLRKVASAGERKAVTLALIAAHGRVLEASGQRPIYLLDDLDAELSRRTLESVWRGFGEPRQVLASSNRPEVFEALNLTAVHSLTGGVVS